MKKKAKGKLGKATLARVKKEMAKPRLAMSAREGETNPATGRMVQTKRGNAKLQLHSLLFCGVHGEAVACPRTVLQNQKLLF